MQHGLDIAEPDQVESVVNIAWRSNIRVVIGSIGRQPKEGFSLES